jgi:thiosulfate dehydrogenase [quinone] large subunit
MQTTWLVGLRLLIGWHFLYEGIAKLLNPKWSAMGYLTDSGGWFSSVFHSMAENPDVLGAVNFLNEWGLVLIGLGLIFGCFTFIASIAGACLLGCYYLSHPPFIGSDDLYMLPREGSYLWIDRNLIEMAALAVLCVFPTSRTFGLDRYIMPMLTKKKSNS